MVAGKGPVTVIIDVTEDEAAAEFIEAMSVMGFRPWTHGTGCPVASWQSTPAEVNEAARRQQQHYAGQEILETSAV